MGLDIAYLQEYQKYITAWWNVGTTQDMLQCLSLQLATWMELAIKNIKFCIKQTKQRLITGLHIKCPHIMTLNLPIMAFVLPVTHVFRSTYYWHQWGVFAVLKSFISDWSDEDQNATRLSTSTWIFITELFPYTRILWESVVVSWKTCDNRHFLL